MAAVLQSSPDKTLGRLPQLGITSLEGLALYCPRDYADLRHPMTHWPAPERVANFEATSVFATFEITTPPQTVAHAQPPRTTVGLRDAQGRDGLGVIWGHDMTTVERLKQTGVGHQVVLQGKFSVFRGEPQIAIQAWVSPRWVGRVMPVYASKRAVMRPDTLRDRMTRHLPEAIPRAARAIERALLGASPQQREAIDPQGQFESLEALLWAAHTPLTPAEGEDALYALDRINALDRVLRAMESRHNRRGTPIVIDPARLEQRMAAFEFPLTGEQRQAVEEIVHDLAKPQGMHRLLTGDVGTGKTAVYASAATAAADAGARVAVLAPSVALAGQIHQDLRAAFPDLDIRRIEAGRNKADNSEANAAAVVVSTTALLHRSGLAPFDLVVVDEQHKFSREQRERLGSTHLLEVSATCIPRSQALLQVGVTQLSRLRNGPVKKQIDTRIRSGEAERRAVFARCRQTVAEGDQLAIIYPLRESDERDTETIKSAEAAATGWERHFPGRVVLVHGQMSAAEKREAIAAMRENRADVLVSTTVIEVGLNLPRLRHLLVVDAERYGLTTLHQLRGRLARHGGVGRLDLYLSRECPEPVWERLRCLEQTDDGFVIAEQDLAFRGQGDIAGDQQSGRGDGMLVNRPVELAAIQIMVSKEGGGRRGTKAAPTPAAEPSGHRKRSAASADPRPTQQSLFDCG